MAYIVRRLQKMDLSFFHAHGATGAGRQRAINIDGWLLPAIGNVPSAVTIRYRHVDDGQIHSEPRKFGKLQKNFRLHGRMIAGAGYARYRRGDLMFMRFSGSVITWSLLRNEGNSANLFRFLTNTSNARWRGNMALVADAPQIRALEARLGRYDAELFFAGEMQGLEEEPQSPTVRRAIRRVMTPAAFRALQQAWERNGQMGEVFVLQRERERLTAAGRPDLAARVVHISHSDPTSPYDILSFEGASPRPEAERYIEVKATSGAGMEFEMSEAEWLFAEDMRHQHVIYRVTAVTGEAPQCREVRDIVGFFLSDASVRRAVAFKVKIV
ncbi:MAG: DUF3883 domain-containing protein [Acidobacteriota bacterium]|nr:DUF3883 domain-containing protein [Acidobacteriota bacterium]